jgi:hypothetical protein
MHFVIKSQQVIEKLWVRFPSNATNTNFLHPSALETCYIFYGFCTANKKKNASQNCQKSSAPSKHRHLNCEQNFKISLPYTGLELFFAQLINSVANILLVGNQEHKFPANL